MKDYVSAVLSCSVYSLLTKPRNERTLKKISIEGIWGTCNEAKLFGLLTGLLSVLLPRHLNLDGHGP